MSEAFLDLPDRIYRMSKELLAGRFIWIVKGLLKIKKSLTGRK